MWNAEDRAKRLGLIVLRCVDHVIVLTPHYFTVGRLVGCGVLLSLCAAFEEIPLETVGWSASSRTLMQLG